MPASAAETEQAADEDSTPGKTTTESHEAFVVALGDNGARQATYEDAGAPSLSPASAGQHGDFDKHPGAGMRDGLSKIQDIAAGQVINPNTHQQAALTVHHVASKSSAAPASVPAGALQGDHGHRSSSPAKILGTPSAADHISASTRHALDLKDQSVPDLKDQNTPGREDAAQAQQLSRDSSCKAYMAAAEGSMQQASDVAESSKSQLNAPIHPACTLQVSSARGHLQTDGPTPEDSDISKLDGSSSLKVPGISPKPDLPFSNGKQPSRHSSNDSANQTFPRTPDSTILHKARESSGHHDASLSRFTKDAQLLAQLSASRNESADQALATKDAYQEAEPKRNSLATQGSELPLPLLDGDHKMRVDQHAKHKGSGRTSGDCPVWPSTHLPCNRPFSQTGIQAESQPAPGNQQALRKSLPFSRPCSHPGVQAESQSASGNQQVLSTSLPCSSPSSTHDLSRKVHPVPGQQKSSRADNPIEPITPDDLQMLHHMDPAACQKLEIADTMQDALVPHMVKCAADFKSKSGDEAEKAVNLASADPMQEATRQDNTAHISERGQDRIRMAQPQACGKSRQASGENSAAESVMTSGRLASMEQAGPQPHQGDMQYCCSVPYIQTHIMQREGGGGGGGGGGVRGP